MFYTGRLFLQAACCDATAVILKSFTAALLRWAKTARHINRPVFSRYIENTAEGDSTRCQNGKIYKSSKTANHRYFQ